MKTLAALVLVLAVPLCLGQRFGKVKTLLKSSASSSGVTLVQAATYDCPNDGSACLIDSTHGGLKTVGTGHLIVALCWSYGANCTAAPTTTPSATLAQLPSVTQNANTTINYTCSSSPFTSFSFGKWRKQIAILEFSGVAGTACSDAAPTYTAFANSTTWTSPASGTLAETTELVFAWAMNASNAATFTCTGPSGSALAFSQAGPQSGYSHGVCWWTTNSTASVQGTGTASSASNTAFAQLYSFKEY